jgi:hypothetical protein
MAFDYDDFLDTFDEFDNPKYSENLITMLIEVSLEYFNDTIWGDKLDLVRKLYVAHFLQLKDIDAENKSNLISEIDVKDELKVKFNQIDYSSKNLTDELKLTYYGKILSSLIKQKANNLITFVRPKGILSNAK